jgi:aspartate aminotransferase
MEGSIIGAAFEQALQLRAEGREIFDLTSGEPDFATPGNVSRAGHEAIDAGATKYTPTDGTEELKAAVALKFQRDNDVVYETSEICIGAGAKPLLYYVLLSILDTDDEVIIPTPAWASFPGMVQLAGARPVLSLCERSTGYKLTPTALEAAITQDTKALILNTPTNPTGAVYNKSEMQALGQVLEAHPRIIVVADEIYEHLVYDVEFTCFVHANPNLKERTVVVNGASKGYAMTGWRIGYAAGPVEVMNTIRKLLSHSAGNPTTLSQLAAIEALTGPQDQVQVRAASYKARRDKAVMTLNQAPGLAVERPDGAFYLYVDCSETIGRRTPDGDKLENSADFCTYLLQSEGVATVPSAGFYAQGALRMSYACDDATLTEACRRMVRACNALV